MSLELLEGEDVFRATGSILAVSDAELMV